MADTNSSKKAIGAAVGNPLMGLTDRQRLFVEGIMKGMPQTTAARAAGFNHPHVAANRLMRTPVVLEAMQYLNHKHEKASQMTRKKVMDGFLEAIEMAKIQSDPGVMVNGCRETGRMCGYYAAEKKIIDVNITAKRAVDKLETLSDAELLEMIERDSKLIEGEFEEVLDATQSLADQHYAEAGYD